MLNTGIDQLNKTMENMDKVYGSCADKRKSMNASTGEGSLAEIIACATE